MRFFKLFDGLTSKMEKLSQRQLIIAALAISILFTVILYVYLSTASRNTAKQKSDNMTSVVVAVKDIPARTTIADDMVKVITVPKDVLPVQFINDTHDVIGKVSQVPIMAGDMITVPKLFSDIRSSGFTGTIPADCRAISLKISDVTGISGFAKPGDYVDVILVSGKNNKNELTGRILLQNILLLGINKSFEQADSTNGNDDKTPAKAADTKAKESPATATLAVQPADALKLAVAQSEGTVFLELRPLNPRDYFVPDIDYTVFQYSEPAANNMPIAGAPANLPLPAYSPPIPQQASASTAVQQSSGSSSNSSTITVIRGTKQDEEGQQ
ncbi:Flp pilus assembly protein CpaB [Pectinatus frisingensis]|uniref:Flp pilus assembly protein CpaB n=1 Tax=Pectinatus frisingensis TaxID=865 RepID=UPI0018C68C61|nr:Flp pilus assembly protein CpaB [Pectinatus frisingensis]